MLLHHEAFTVATDTSLTTLGFMLSAAVTWLAIGIDALRRKFAQRRRRED